MRFAIGTENPTKVASLREALDSYDLFRGSDIQTIKVVSAVSDQPSTLDETLQGALHRAVEAYNTGADFGVGIESGFMPSRHSRTGWIEFTSCFFHNDAHTWSGISPGFECPAEVTRLVHEEGMNLSEAAHAAGLTEHPYVGAAEGIIGVLTKGRITRKDYTVQALHMALMHLT